MSRSHISTVEFAWSGWASYRPKIFLLNDDKSELLEVLFSFIAYFLLKSKNNDSSIYFWRPWRIKWGLFESRCRQFENPITSLYKKICNETCIFISHPDFCKEASIIFLEQHFFFQNGDQELIIIKKYFFSFILNTHYVNVIPFS